VIGAALGGSPGAFLLGGPKRTIGIAARSATDATITGEPESPIAQRRPTGTRHPSNGPRIRPAETKNRMPAVLSFQPPALFFSARSALPQRPRALLRPGRLVVIQRRVQRTGVVQVLVAAVFTAQWTLGKITQRIENPLDSASYPTDILGSGIRTGRELLPQRTYRRRSALGSVHSPQGAGVMRVFRPHLGQVRPLTIGPALMALPAAARRRAAAGQTLASRPLGRPAVGRLVETAVRTTPGPRPARLRIPLSHTIRFRTERFGRTAYRVPVAHLLRARRCSAAPRTSRSTVPFPLRQGCHCRWPYAPRGSPS